MPSEQPRPVLELELWEGQGIAQATVVRLVSGDGQILFTSQNQADTADGDCACLNIEEPLTQHSHPRFRRTEERRGEESLFDGSNDDGPSC